MQKSLTQQNNKNNKKYKKYKSENQLKSNKRINKTAIESNAKMFPIYS